MTDAIIILNLCCRIQEQIRNNEAHKNDILIDEALAVLEEMLVSKKISTYSAYLRSYIFKTIDMADAHLNHEVVIPIK